MPLSFTFTAALPLGVFVAKSRIKGIMGHQGQFDPSGMDPAMKETLRPGSTRKPKTGAPPSGSSMGGKIYVPKKVKQPKRRGK